MLGLSHIGLALFTFLLGVLEGLTCLDGTRPSGHRLLFGLVLPPLVCGAAATLAPRLPEPWRYLGLALCLGSAAFSAWRVPGGPLTVVALAVSAGFADMNAGVSLGAGLALGHTVPGWMAWRMPLRLPPEGAWRRTAQMVRTAMALFAGFYLGRLLGLGDPVLHWGHRDALAIGMGILGAACGAALLAPARAAAGRRNPTLLGGAGALFLSAGLALVLFGEVRVPLASVPPIVWESSHDAGITRGHLEHRPVILDFTADWCVACKELEKVTYVDAAVRRVAMRFVAVQIDCTAMDEPVNKLFERYQIVGLPTVIFIDSAGTVLSQPRLTGFVPPDRFIELLAQVP